MQHPNPSQFDTNKECFGRWLLAQSKREDQIGDLARDASKDPGFPKDGDVKAVSKRLNTVGAPPELHEALDDAETDWLAI
ncbi:hypothetical protein HHL26_04805 [Sphingobium sp. TB-6]|uniref:YozE family protein n=1 Tax=Sphingobium sp. TB-6 TaxID=2728850 RepID=UPI00146BAA0A|nr:YozE family protein [Sphingobium sp. TB-6]NML88385.1 hypothetical protein [Sphingobium sp. TB-6]